MASIHTTPSESPSEVRPPSWALQRMLDENQRSWTPLCLSSHSASTEYFSNIGTPHAVANSEFFWATPPQAMSKSLLSRDREESQPRAGLPDWTDKNPSLPPSSPENSFRIPSNGDSWTEELPWSEPIALEHPMSRCCEFVPDDATEDSYSEPASETPTELRYTMSQEEVEQDMIEMTCGPKLEEQFWPIRYQIRHGKLHVPRFIFSSSLTEDQFLLAGL
ncbi:hypothetical protein C8R45DRAFT_250693 [Mycena sanguinolenta]|nr:hypothetical protein C8R45DRAFT_250693 [Mycena sanguinolenta]